MMFTQTTKSRTRVTLLSKSIGAFYVGLNNWWFSPFIHRFYVSLAPQLNCSSAQSLACAQSIAHSHIGDNICKKNLNFWKIIFTGDKKGNSAAHSWTKNHIFSFKSGKWSCSKKVVFIFCKNFAGRFFWHQRIFADFKTGFYKDSITITYIPISRWGYGETIRRKFIRNPQFFS